MKVIFKINSLKPLTKVIQHLETEIYLPPIDPHCSSSEHAYGGQIKQQEVNQIPTVLS